MSMLHMTRRRWLHAGLTALLVTGAWRAAATVGPDTVTAATDAPVVEVSRGEVVATVTTSGALVAPGDLGLDFSTGGRLTDVSVAVGDQVRAGQVLARVDDTEAKDAVSQADANLTTARAQLAELTGGETTAERTVSALELRQSAQSLQEAEATLAEARASAAVSAKGYERAVAEARERLSRTERDLVRKVELAEQTLAAARAELAELEAGLSAAERERAETRVERARQAVAAAETALEHAGEDAALNADAYDLAVEQAQDAEDTAEDALDAAEEAVQEAEDALEDCDDDCDDEEADLEAAEEALDDAEREEEQADQAAEAAELARDQGLARDQQAIVAAEQTLEEARLDHRIAEQDYADAQTPAGTAELARARAAVLEAEQRLVEAREAADETPLAEAELAREQGLLRDAQSIAQAERRLAGQRLTHELTQAQRRVATQGPGAEDLARARQSLRSAEIELERAQRDLDGSVLHAPVDGTVAAVGADTGEFVGSAGAAADGETVSGFVVLTDIDGLVVEAEVPEADADEVAPGQEATITPNADEDSPLSGTVLAIDPVPNSDGDLVTYTVRLALAEQPEHLRTGQTVQVDIVVERVEDVLVVPSAAVSSAGGRSTVRVLNDDGQEEVRTVTVGVEGDTTTAIIDGLREGERVVVTAAAPAQDGGMPAGGGAGRMGPGGGGGRMGPGGGAVRIGPRGGGG